MDTQAYAPARAHDPITEIGPEIYMVRGEMAMNRVLTISRNMAIVRNGEELTLINPVRLGEDGLAALERLGRVRHVLRLGPFHGIDDPFYMARYKALFWCQPGGTTYPEPPVDRPLVDGGELPFDDAALFTFEHTVQPEAALLMRGGEGMLLTCDAIQHYGDYSHNNLPARLLMPFIGFPRTTIVGPLWLKIMTPPGGSLRGEFARLLQLSFDSLLSAHGTLLDHGAHGAVTVAVAHAFRDD